MILTCTIQIGAPPEEVWRLLIDPEHIRSWNNRVRVIVPVSQGCLRDGSKIRIRYTLRGRESNYLAEVLEYEEHTRLVVHITGGNLPLRGYVQEIYQLAANARGTLLTQQTVLENTGINLISRSCMKGSHLFSGLAGKRYLSGLKHLAEKAQ